MSLLKFSRRARWDAPSNRLTLARDERRARGDEILDLTESNPTRAALPYPLDQLSGAMARAACAPYDPQPLGIPSAREAVAAQLGAHPDDVAITASTSEAYSFLFKLLADPGDAVAIATPSYPLLEHLASMELVALRSFPLEFHRRWELDAARVRDAVDERTKAIVVVNPNNPTGSFVTPEEQDGLASLGLPLISDEVFLDYPLDCDDPWRAGFSRPDVRDTRPAEAGPPKSLVRDDVLAFTLGGLSKSAGLPHFKLGWIRVSGPGKSEAMNALELIADNFLSVATPVQAALPELLRIAPQIRAAIRERTRANLVTLRETISDVAAARVLPVEGGWSAVIRVPRVQSDEELALALLERGVLVHPGYFFDFESDGYVVVSLLTEPATLAEGIRRLAAIIRA